MAIFAPKEFRFLETVVQIAFANPFSPERLVLERAALGKEAASGGALVWSRTQLDVHDETLKQLAARAAATVEAARQSLKDGKTASKQELVLYEDAALYVLYDRYREEFQSAVTAAMAGGPSAKVPFWTKFKHEFDLYFAIPECRLPSNYEPAHIFAGFFQVRRAFHHIFDYIVGQSKAIARLRAAVWESIFTHNLRRYRQSLYRRMSEFTTLICGPSGTGKELVARAVGLSRYIAFDEKKACFDDDFLGSFHAVNLSALSPSLVESELFGHTKGSFTGATGDRVGWFEQCSALGTVFLDEIGELETAIQVKLLRVVQTRSFSRVGNTLLRQFRGKLIAATNRDLAKEMQAGRFREDLYYRLCSDLIVTVSLREQLADRPEDLHELIRFTAERIAGEHAEELTAEVEHWIAAKLGVDYPWPGNIRELEQCVRNCLVRGEYYPTLPCKSDDHAKVWLQEAERGTLTADELLTQYCRWVHRQVGTYDGTAARIALDRRTVKRRIVDIGD